MKISIIHAHWFNRGDEAALRAMIDELHLIYPNAEVVVQILGTPIWFPYSKEIRLIDGNLPQGKKFRWVDYCLLYLTKGRLSLKKESRRFVSEIASSDLVLHAPGGPSLGDIYIRSEKFYLARLLMVRRLKVPYAFYSPSMGPFEKKTYSKIRKKILMDAAFLAVREPVSKSYLVKYGIPANKVLVTLDSAFQHDICESLYNQQLQDDIELQKLLKSGSKIIGITVTNLQWNPRYKGAKDIIDCISKTFQSMIKWLTSSGFKVLFIPQLFGNNNDAGYMNSFANSNCYVLPVIKENDCYYQQFIIGKLFAVIGMRYHSNIFSAKMGTPFISVSYEQKMIGFMRKAGLEDYCIDITDLSFEALWEKFELLCTNYNMYQSYLQKQHDKWKREAYVSTALVKETINKIMTKKHSDETN